MNGTQVIGALGCSLLLYWPASMTVMSPGFLDVASHCHCPPDSKTNFPFSSWEAPAPCQLFLQSLAQRQSTGSWGAPAIPIQNGKILSFFSACIGAHSIQFYFNLDIWQVKAFIFICLHEWCSNVHVYKGVGTSLWRSLPCVASPFPTGPPLQHQKSDCLKYFSSSVEMACLLHNSTLCVCAAVYGQGHKLFYKGDPWADLINNPYHSEALDESLRRWSNQPQVIGKGLRKAGVVCTLCMSGKNRTYGRCRDNELGMTNPVFTHWTGSPCQAPLLE